ncbi:MAG: hypothetical protein J6V11_00340, partial [Alphaproteobacteria bacterium]|nr:hypothetical protein [Alphaproteobacteria bacterium]
ATFGLPGILKKSQRLQRLSGKNVKKPATFRDLQGCKNFRKKGYKFLGFPEFFHLKPRKYSILQ